MTTLPLDHLLSMCSGIRSEFRSTKIDQRRAAQPDQAEREANNFSRRAQTDRLSSMTSARLFATVSPGGKIFLSCPALPCPALPCPALPRTSALLGGTH